MAVVAFCAKWLMLIVPIPTMVTKNNQLPLVMMTQRYEKATALSNSIEDEERRVNFALENESTAFGLDNCATHHICVDRRLFTEMSED